MVIQDKNHVTLYDSLSLSIPLRTKEQIFCDNKEFSIDIPDVQKQQGGSDCRLYCLGIYNITLC